MTYQVIHELQLVVECWFGEITSDKIVSARLKQSEDSNWNINYTTLCDMRMAKFPDAHTEVEKLIEYGKTDRRWTNKRKVVHLTDSPDHVVFQTLLKNFKPNDFQNILEVFSTLNSSLQWLGIDLQESNRIEQILRQLKNSASSH